MGFPAAARSVVLIAMANILLGLALLTLHSPVRAVPDDATNPPDLPRPIQQLLGRIDQGSHGEPYTLLLTDAELTAATSYFLASDPSLPFTRARITNTGGNMMLDGVTRGTGLAIPVRVTAAVGAADGIPWARVENISLGDTGLPGFIRDQIIQQINASLNFSQYDLLIRVDAVDLGRGSVAIRGSIK